MKKILPLIILALFSGCSIHTPAITEYSLFSAEPSGITPFSTSLPKSIKLNAPITLSSLATKSIHYSTSTQESGNYLYSAWSDTPSSMIENTLFLALQHSNLFATVTPSASWAKTDYILESNLAIFQHTIKEDGSSEGIIDITYRLIDLESKKVIATKHFCTTQPSVSNNAKGGVEALKKNIDKVNRQVIEWLSLTLNQQKV
jgi:cholesterol transport system auxiliary component